MIISRELDYAVRIIRQLNKTETSNAARIEAEECVSKDFARKILPWFDLNLGWVVPALVGLILGLIIRQIKKGRPAAAAAK